MNLNDSNTNVVHFTPQRIPPLAGTRAAYMCGATFPRQKQPPAWQLGDMFRLRGSEERAWAGGELNEGAWEEEGWDFLGQGGSGRRGKGELKEDEFGVAPGKLRYPPTPRLPCLRY